MPPINYAWIIFFLDCVKCLMLIPLSIRYPLLLRDIPICILSKWVFFSKIYQPHSDIWNENTEAELWFLHINWNCRGHRQSSEALSADNLHGCKSADRKHPQKPRKYRGVPVNPFIGATACVKRETRWWDRSRGRRWREVEVGGRGGGLHWPDLSQLQACWASEYWSPRGPHWGPRSLIMTSVWPW